MAEERELEAGADLIACQSSPMGIGGELGDSKKRQIPNRRLRSV